VHVFVAVAGCTAAGAGQVGQSSVSETERRVAEMSARFPDMLTPSVEELELTNREEISRRSAARHAGMNKLADEIHAEMDRYVTSTVTPKSIDSRWVALAKEMTTILATADHGRPPVVMDPRSTPGALVVAYTLHKGGWHGDGATSFRLRAYRPQGGLLKLADATGADMDGYGDNSVHTLRAPGAASGEVWFVVRGQMTGANGPNIRMRAYMYKTGTFTTMWMPANAWGNFTIRITDHGFVVDGPYYRENARRHENFFVSPGYISVAGGSQ
jgi:hypothetical protein